MLEFRTSLLREKFVIHDAASDQKERASLIALSNRVTLPFKSPNGENTEFFVVRAHTMHLALRMSARMAHDFYEMRYIINGSKPYDWDQCYQALIKGYEEKWNPNRWVAVYYKGKLVFEAGEADRHPFLDIIEKADALNQDDYEKCIPFAEDMFRKANRDVRIEHDANVACIVNLAKNKVKCGIILRGPDKTTTFNFSAVGLGNKPPLKVSQCLGVCAAFLEAIQLCFMVGMTHTKLKYDLIESDSDLAKQTKDAEERIAKLNAAIKQFEQVSDIMFRPERPKFNQMIIEAEKFARKVLNDSIEKHIAESDEGEWVV